MRKITDVEYIKDRQCIRYVEKISKQERLIREIYLTYIENSIFEKLYETLISDKVFLYNDLEYLQESGATRTAITRLRSKIGKLYRIKNIRKVGYVLVRR